MTYNFITLKKATSDESPIDINPIFIESIDRYETETIKRTEIMMFSGKVHYIKETPKEIKKIMEQPKTFYTTNKKDEQI
jgi:hypothetical protein